MSDTNGQQPLLSITVDGAPVTLRLDDLTAVDARDFRLAVGVPLAKVVADGSSDLDVIAGLVWLSRRRRQPGLTYEQVAGKLTYASIGTDSTPAAETEESGDPE